MSYTGLDGCRRETQLRFAPQPTRLDAESRYLRVRFGADERASIFIEIRCETPSPNAPPWKLFFSSLRDARRDLRASLDTRGDVETSHDIFNEVVRRSIADLYMLTTNLPEGPYPYAGIPWFSTVFGRDALSPRCKLSGSIPPLRAACSSISPRTRRRPDAAADAEPGKILHEARRGEMAELGEVPFRRYYGSINSTPFFIMLAGAYLERTEMSRPSASSGRISRRR